MKSKEKKNNVKFLIVRKELFNVILSQVASTCNDLEQGLGSQPEIELGHSGESTDSGSGLQLPHSYVSSAVGSSRFLFFSLLGRDH